MNVGRLRKALLAPRALALLAGLVLVGSLGFAWGFVVDDALVVSRFAWVARHGGPHAFLLEGPAVDGVTPLLLPWLLAPFARSVLGALAVQRFLGFGAVVVGGALLAHRLATRVGGRSLAALAFVASSFPLAVHASSGLETGLTTGLVAAGLAFALSEAELDVGALVFGLACTLRPELLPGALAAVAVRLTHARAFGLLLRVLAPSALVAVVRLLAFGSPVPLAVLAKPSDLRHGVVYVAAGVLVSGLVAAPLLAIGGKGVSGALAGARRTALALVGVHAVTVALLGGDWMPYARLLVPVVPALAVVVASAPLVPPRALLVAAVMATHVLVGWRHRGEAVDVASQRERVVAALAPHLAGLATVAGLDVGFLGASFPGRIVDLAGLTDPAVARLRGGHTSKVLPEGFLDARSVDAVVFWAPEGSVVELGSGALFGRVVETRLARSPAVRASFTEYARVPWDARGAELVVFRRSAPIR